MTIAKRIIGAAQVPLGIALGWIRGLEEYLGPEDDWVEDDRRYVYETVDKILRPLGRSTISEVSDNDYVRTVHQTSDEVEEILDPKYQRNVLSTRKYRITERGNRQWAVGSFAHDPANTGWQHHVILFDTEFGETDIYAHEEASVRDPINHHGGGEIEHGDPYGRLPNELNY